MSGSGRSRAYRLIPTLALGLGLGLTVASGGVGRHDVAAAPVAVRVAAALVGAAFGVAMVLGFTGLTRALTGRMPKSSIVAAALLLAAAVGGLAAIDLTNGGDDTSSEPRQFDIAPFDAGADGGDAPTRQPFSTERDDPIQIDFDLGGTVVLLFALGLLGAAVVFFARRTDTRPIGYGGVYLESTLDARDADEPDEAAIVAALHGPLMLLDLDGSPADRIRAAYAEMLRNLEAIGLPRHSAEPPGAYIGRCLRSGRLPDSPVRELLSLFEHARFSTDQMTEGDVDRARTALELITAELASAR